ncbi:MAG TPA: nucleotidyltransferase family protein, partial [Candidatus Marinimicrobia bacterium]|nr:nucleotidyltransferase family protein [Candidatus Neomarinimicrobiota bacterium]
MKALILAAGLGKRLRPLTNQKPKALIEVGGRPLLQIAIEYLQMYGFDEIIINVHHYADQIIKYLEVNKYLGQNIIISDETDQLLDTGGALKKAAWFFEDSQPFLVYNVDILCDLDLRQFCKYHRESGALATLAVRQRSSERYLLFDEANVLCGWQNLKTGEIIQTRLSDSPLCQLAFSGISVLSPEILRYLPHKNIFSLIDLYL